MADHPALWVHYVCSLISWRGWVHRELEANRNCQDPCKSFVPAHCWQNHPRIPCNGASICTLSPQFSEKFVPLVTHFSHSVGSVVWGVFSHENSAYTAAYSLCRYFAKITSSAGKSEVSSGTGTNSSEVYSVY